jgi:hypothetical protein
MQLNRAIKEFVGERYFYLAKFCFNLINFIVSAFKV